MADHVLERRVWVPRPRPAVFEFFADPRNLPLVQPPTTRLRWLVPPPATVAAGTVLDFRVWWLAVLPSRWRVMIRELDRPYRFVDVQLWGPFQRWEHRHRFTVDEPPTGATGPGTWIEDRITYRMPLGAAGALVHRAGFARALGRQFDYRERRIRELLGAPG
jgi:ligand-binding SRPBCC domain-containing protein